MKIPFLIATIILLVAPYSQSETIATEPPDSDIAKTNQFSDVEMQGYNLARQILAQNPTQLVSQTGIIVLRNPHGKNATFPLKFSAMASANSDSWVGDYLVSKGTNSYLEEDRLLVVHQFNRYNRYQNLIAIYTNQYDTNSEPNEVLPIYLYREQTMIPFAGSDFWICDLGLEFFHWPRQKILKKENRRGRGCMVLESTNPEPSTNGYSRVVSWIDEESGGIVQAEAYDFKNKLLKEFAPKSFKKVNGQWELQEMEIDNVQTGSRTRIEFDLKAK